MTTYEILHNRLQPIYADLLREHGITSSDIDPRTNEMLEKAERYLAAIVEIWLRLAA